MANRELTPFELLLPTTEFRTGKLLRAILWAVFGALCFAGVLVCVYIAVDLVIRGGREHVSKISIWDIEWTRPAEPPAPLPVVEGEPRRTGLPEIWGPIVAGTFHKIPYIESDTSALFTLVAIGALLSLVANRAFNRARNLCLRDALDRVTRVRLQLHRQVLRLGPSDLEGTEHSAGMKLFVEDSNALRDALFRRADTLTRDPLLLGVVGLLPLTNTPILALQCGIPLLACGYLVREMSRRLRSSERLANAQADHELDLLAESLQKTRLIRGYSMDEFEGRQFERYLMRYETQVSSVLYNRRRTERLSIALACLVIGFVLFVLGGKVLFEPFEISVAATILILAAFLGVALPLARLAGLRREMSAGREAAVRIQNYLTKIPEVGQAVGAKFLSPLSKTLELEGVRYAVDGLPILDGFSVRLDAGKQIGLIATNPLEARAVAYLLPRFIEPQAGRVMFDHEDIAWVTLDSLRAETIFVGGSDPFFTGTVAENLAAGDSRYSLQDLTDAAKLAHAHSFIQKLPQGYETAIGEHGEALDAGQAFRLGLARALLRKPALLVIEEPPAHLLDEETKAMIDDAYLRIAPGRTVIYLPTRLTTIRRCDPLVLIHRGKLEAVGPRARMVQHSALYQHWEYLNFNEFRHEVDGPSATSPNS